LTILERGQRMAVCKKTFEIYQKEPYAEQIIAVNPIEEVAEDTAKSFDCKRSVKRHPRETKGLDYDVTDISKELCSTDGCC
jgi:arsenite methyltransferase